MFAFLLGLLLGAALGYGLTGLFEEKNQDHYDDWDDWGKL